MSAPFKEQRTQGTPSTLQCDGSLCWGLSLQRPFLPLPVPSHQRESRLSDHLPPPTRAQELFWREAPVITGWSPTCELFPEPQSSWTPGRPPSAALPEAGQVLCHLLPEVGIYWFVWALSLVNLSRASWRFLQLRYLRAPLQMAECVMHSEEGVTRRPFPE